MNQQENILIQTIKKLEDLDEATTALTELKFENREKARELALQILEEERGDCHLQASAIEVLYSTDREAGLRLIEAAADSVKAVVLKAMLECVAEDSPLIGSAPKILAVAAKLQRRTTTLTSEERAVLGDSLEWFTQAFAGILDSSPT